MGAESQTQKNTKLYVAFQHCCVLPFWHTTMCHTTKSHKFDRQVTWLSIMKSFKLTAVETKLLKGIHKLSTNGGWSLIYKDVPMKKHKARTIRTLIDKHVVKKIDGHVVLNPAILIGRAGWSQFLLGQMLIQWMHEERVIPIVTTCEEDICSIAAGAEVALSNQYMISIPHSIKGRVEGDLGHPNAGYTVPL